MSEIAGAYNSPYYFPLTYWPAGGPYPDPSLTPTPYFAPSYFCPAFWPTIGAAPRFSDATIREVLHVQDATDLHIRWSSSAPEGSVFQVYVAGRLAWSGTSRSITIPTPTGFASIHVGVVASGDEDRDFSASIPKPDGSGDRARLSWLGGTYLDPTGRDDVQGFRIFGSPGPDFPIDTQTPLTTLAAYPGGLIADGFGRGGFGQGGFGRSASWYSWTSERLTSGTWQFAVRSFDVAGNDALGETTVSIQIATRPRPPARDDRGRRLNYTFDPETRIVSLAWLPSPG